mgnify:CR=1 FL=1
MFNEPLEIDKMLAFGRTPNKNESDEEMEAEFADTESKNPVSSQNLF